jgi:hypothetical protein
MSQDSEIARHDERLRIVEKGVSNFRDFQVEAREFFSEYRAVRKEREEAEKKAIKLAEEVELKCLARRRETRSNRIAIASILAPLVLALSGWLGAKVAKSADDMYQMLQEWESVHKSEIPAKVSSSDGSAHASNSHQQDAGGSMPPLH